MRWGSRPNRRRRELVKLANRHARYPESGGESTLSGRTKELAEITAHSGQRRGLLLRRRLATLETSRHQRSIAVKLEVADQHPALAFQPRVRD